MKNHEYIKSICLLGTDRQQLDLNKLSEPLDVMIGELSDKEPAEKILHALALDHYYRMAGTELPSIDKPLTHSPIVETKDYAPEQFYTILKQILDLTKQQTQATLLTSWINKLREYNMVVHPMYLVKYLNTLLGTTKAIKNLAAPTLGKKGAWLCQQNHKYDKLTRQDEDDIWSFGTSQQRQLFLEALLQDDPDKALQLVRENWGTENQREKLKHLKLFLNHTHPNHITFVQELYDEEFAYNLKETVTQRESRNTLAKILMINLESDLHQNTIDKLSNYLTGKKKGLLSKVFQGQGEIINIPDTDDTFFNGQNMLETYGIDIQSTRAADYKTDQVYWFSELCSAIPFSVWSIISMTKPKHILTEFLESDKFQIVVNNKKVSGLKDALVNLADRYHNDEFTILLLGLTKQSETERLLLSKLTPAAWEKYLVKNLDVIDNQILRDCPHRDDKMWSLEFSEKTLSYTVDRLDNKSHNYDYNIGLTIAEYIHINATQQLVQLNNGKARKSKQYNYWKNHIFDPIYQTISIKNQIHKL